MEHALLSSLSKYSMSTQGQGTMLGAGESADITTCIRLVPLPQQIATNSVQIYLMDL